MDVHLADVGTRASYLEGVKALTIVLDVTTNLRKDRTQSKRIAHSVSTNACMSQLRKVLSVLHALLAACCQLPPRPMPTAHSMCTCSLHKQ
jgi:hypothetical protein